MGKTRGFEDLEVYRLSEDVADGIWDVVVAWPAFARDTVGKQVVRAADSIGVNIAEGAGRGTYQDNRRFVCYARGSMNETRHFLRRAFRRKLLTQEQIDRFAPLLGELGPRLNRYLQSIGGTSPRRRPASDE